MISFNKMIIWIFTGIIVLLGLCANLYLLYKDDFDIEHILYINNKKFFLKNNSISEDTYIFFLSKDKKLINNNLEKIKDYIKKDYDFKNAFLKKYFNKINENKIKMYVYNVFDIDNLYILNSSENRNKLNFKTSFSYYNESMIHLFKKHENIPHYDIFLNYNFQFSKNIEDDLTKTTTISKAHFKLDINKMENYFICYSIFYFKQNKENIFFDFEDNKLLSSKHKRLWMHEFIETYILKVVLNLDNLNNKDIFIRWVQDGLSEFYAEKIVLENFNEINNILVSTSSKEQSNESEIDILRWGISPIFKQDFEVLKNNTDLYLKSKNLFNKIEKQHGYKPIENLLIFMQNTKKLTSEKVLLFFEEEIGKENLEKLIGINYIERVNQVRIEFFEEVLEKYKDNKEILKLISGQEYISSPEKIKIKARNILK
ncbi:MAG: hypothetical protein M0R46_01545 [Candidatus Muirbacterium halophilum]|nr:hypothetical protein [Candidatus Muirbacterium halophilum]MCK9474579.1 hypothetical protein [Candidatus Muirbacterium halophilum]